MNPLDQLLQSRYGPSAAIPRNRDDAFEAAGPIIERMLAHRSIRAFDKRALPPNTLPMMVAAAQSAASSSNLQAWSVIAITDAARKARLAKWANNQAHIEQAPLFLVWLADLSRLDRVASRRDEASEANRFFEMFLVAVIDAALAAQNATLAAESLGLGTVYIGAMRNKPDEVAEELRLPPRSFALFGQCVGHIDSTRPAADIKPRLSQDVVLHHEHYQTESEASGVVAYDDVMAGFQRQQSLPAVLWSQQTASRVRDAKTLSGRHGLIDSIRKRGFELD